MEERFVADLQKEDVLFFLSQLHHMPTVAIRAVNVLVKMFKFGEAWRWRPSGSNPARSVPRFKVEKHERFVTREELWAAPTERLASTRAAAAN